MVFTSCTPAPSNESLTLPTIFLSFFWILSEGSGERACKYVWSRVLIQGLSYFKLTSQHLAIKNFFEILAKFFLSTCADKNSITSSSLYQVWNPFLSEGICSSSKFWLLGCHEKTCAIKVMIFKKNFWLFLITRVKVIFL